MPDRSDPQTAGPALDRLVAEKVLGRPYRNPSGWQMQYEGDVRDAFSTDIAHAWAVVEALAARGVAIAVRFNARSDGGNHWAKAGTWSAGRLNEESTSQMLSEETGETVYYLDWNDTADGDTAALAICRFALAIAARHPI